MAAVATHIIGFAKEKRKQPSVARRSPLLTVRHPFSILLFLSLMVLTSVSERLCISMVGASGGLSIFLNVKGVARRRLGVQSKANARRYPPLPPLSCSANHWFSLEIDSMTSASFAAVAISFWTSSGGNSNPLILWTQDTCSPFANFLNASLSGPTPLS